MADVTLMMPAYASRVTIVTRDQLPSLPIASMGDVAQHATQPAVPARCRWPAALPTLKVSVALLKA